MFFVRLIVAICVVSFLLNGGRVRDPSTEEAAYPTTAHESAANVVYALSTLRTFCDDRPAICRTAREIGGVAKEAAAGAAGYIADLLADEPKPEETRRAERAKDARPL